MNNLRARLAPLFLVLVFAACGDAGVGTGEGFDDVPEAERYGGTAVMGSIGDIPDMNPLTSTDHTSNQFQQYVLFMPLIRYNADFQPEPYFARSWELNADTTLLTFHLRNDVHWHDGVKTTAHDVKFSYDRANDPATGFANTAFWTHYGEAEVVDSFTFRIQMRPHADFLDPWRAFAPVPQHILGDVPPAQTRNHPFSTSSPLGNGPFRFVSRAVGQNWVFAANENFPAELGGRPYLDRLVYRSIPEQTTLLTELLTGRIDYYVAPRPDQAAQIEASGRARLISYQDRTFTLIGWNQRRPMFEDARVRRALTMAIDRQSIIDGMLFGYGDIANSTVPPIFWNYDPEAGEGLRYDPEGARRLLAEAGWMDRNNDGILEDEQGRPFRFTMKTNQGNQTRADVAEKVQSDLRRVGIVAEPRIVEWGTLLDDINNPRVRNFDAVIIGWVTEFRIDDSDLFHCDKRDERYQWVGYCNPEVDRLLDALPTVVDRDAARPLWHQYQRLIARDQPYTFLFFPQRLQGISNRLRDVNPDARGDWVGARDWWIVPNQRGATGGAGQASPAAAPED
jgi:peptide/nickel transport system substrate-binding protein